MATVVLGLPALAAPIASAVPSPTPSPTPSAFPSDDGPAGLAFYSAPQRTIAAGPHGSVIWSRPLHGLPGLPGAHSYLVLYRSVDMHGHPVAVSGTVSVPDGPAPSGGWPLISWSHGTTGVADICAPSRDTGPDYPAHDYTSIVDVLHSRWIAAGYAVAQTDYQGLGTDGKHGYLIGIAEERAVADLATAARNLQPAIGTRWLAIGHSQGGQAAVFTDAFGPEWAPGMRLLGAAALAPASHVGAMVGSARTLPIASAFTPLIIDGARTVANLNLPAMLTPTALRLMPLADTGCIAQLRASRWNELPLNQVYRPNADLSALGRVLDDNDPSGLRFTQPLLVLQGTADEAVTPTGTYAMVSQLALDGQPVALKVYPGADHRGLLAASFNDVLAWANARFGR